MSGLAIGIQALLGAPSVTAIVGNRIFPSVAPQNARPPLLIVRRVGEPDEQLLTGAGRYRETRLSVECVATTATVSNDMGEAVITALQDLTNAVIAGRTATFTKEGSDYDDYSDDLTAFRRIVDFQIRWR